MIDFLAGIYEVNCNEGDYIFLTTLGKGMESNTWKEHPIKYSRRTIKSALKDFFRKFPASKYNLYFSPVGYSKPRRLKEYANDTKFLIQDIDEVPIKSVRPKPTYRWQSSPGKWVGMWELDRYIPENLYSLLNTHFAHRLGADDASDMVHVYRVPETINHKYKQKPKVGKVFKGKGQVLFRLTRFKKEIGFTKNSIQKDKKKAKPVNTGDKLERSIYAKYNIPQKIREYLALDSLDEIDDRSKTIWYIENVLINDVGMAPNDVIYLIKNSVFNKYSGRRDEEKQLHRELKKIIEGKVETSSDSKKKKRKGRRFNTVSFSDMRANSHQKLEWLVKGFWGKNSNGIVAGMPKSYKSTITTDLAISVASGRPFLGIYPVETQGSVLIIQNENSEAILNDRLHKIGSAKGLSGKIKVTSSGISGEMPEKLPITFVNNQGFNLSSEEDCEEFEYLLKKYKPVLTILDPLYLMLTGDMNSAQDLNPILNYLNQLRDKYETSIMLIHHYNKGNAQGTTQRGGQRMAGSVFLYGWIENAWYFEKERDEDTGMVDLNFTREFRGAGDYPELSLQLIMGSSEDEDATYNVQVFEGGKMINMDELEKTASEFFKHNPRTTLTSRYIKQQLALADNTQRDKILKRLLKRKKIKKVKGGYRLNEDATWKETG